MTYIAFTPNELQSAVNFRHVSEEYSSKQNTLVFVCLDMGKYFCFEMTVFCTLQFEDTDIYLQ